MKKILIVSLVALSGCAGVKTSISFSKQHYDEAKVSGTVTGKFATVQEFRSLLESLEYRVSEKAK